MLVGLTSYALLVALGFLADWHLAYPAVYWWAVPLIPSGLGVAIMYLRAPAHRVAFADGEEE
ncbi:MAG: hypothetical protein CMF75_05325 [Maricaulis sp.]|nr:hypothetical protein [Maricaulis sp.]